MSNLFDHLMLAMVHTVGLNLENQGLLPIGTISVMTNEELEYTNNPVLKQMITSEPKPKKAKKKKCKLCGRTDLDMRYGVCCACAFPDKYTAKNTSDLIDLNFNKETGIYE